MKRGQLSIFVLIGVIVLMSFLFLTMFRDSSESIDNPLEEDVALVQTFVEECMERVGKDALVFVAGSGGHFPEPEIGATVEYRQVPYYFIDEKSHVPEKSLFEESFALYMEEELPYCVSDLEQYPWLDFEYDAIEVTSTLTPFEILYHTMLPITIQKGEKKQTVSEYLVNVNIPFNRAYEAARLITKEQELDTKALCLSCLLEVATEQNVTITFENLGDETLLFRIFLNHTEAEERLIELDFAHKYQLQ